MGCSGIENCHALVRCVYIQNNQAGDKTGRALSTLLFVGNIQDFIEDTFFVLNYILNCFKFNINCLILK